LRWLGPFQDETAIGEVAKELQVQHHACRNGHHFRLIFFSKRQRRAVEDLGIQQITFDEIAEFFVNVRAACWQSYGLGVRSDHHQWDPLIVKAWALADPERDAPATQKAQDILGLL